jgi:cAMP-dependent protein kinase regulator
MKQAMNPKEDPIEVFKYSSGDYFGELALLRNQTRAASIKAVSYLEVVALDRESFKRLIGPLEDILKRNESRYKDYL